VPKKTRKKGKPPKRDDLVGGAKTKKSKPSKKPVRKRGVDRPKRKPQPGPHGL
jgi:hypothetical protein